MPILRTTSMTSLLTLTLASSALVFSGCGDKGGYKGGKKSAAYEWLESPKSGSKDGNFLKIPTLGAQLEIPETLYVFKECSETSHSPEGDNQWVPIFRCETVGGSSDSDSDDEFAEPSSNDNEDLAMTFYLTKKTRPLDERSVAYFENDLRGKGYSVDEVAFNDSYHDKKGIYFKYQEVNSDGDAIREIVEFMFPFKDVVFIAHMDYPFGETRSVNADWSAIMWYFKFTMPGS
ncbi:MAG TPA: hypothetical protein ENJ18_07435 [Nannocystis exedens]|nr:hypothetical protein [Nannocystis exedens]